MKVRPSDAPIFTPVLRATGERLRIEHPIFEVGYRHGTGLGRKGIVYDPKTGKRYMISGRACGLQCQCDAWAVEID